MRIRVTLDAVLVDRGLKAKDVAAAVGVSETHLSLFRSGKVKGVRFETLAKLCEALGCKPGDLLDIEPNEGDGRRLGSRAGAREADESA